MIKLIIAILIMICGLFLASRLQVFEDAKIVTKSSQVLEGTISRSLIDGNYIVSKADSSQITITSDQFAAMTYEGSAITTRSIIVVLISFLFALVVWFGWFGVIYDNLYGRMCLVKIIFLNLISLLILGIISYLTNAGTGEIILYAVIIFTALSLSVTLNLCMVDEG